MWRGAANPPQPYNLITHAVDLCFAKTAPPPTWGTFLAVT